MFSFVLCSYDVDMFCLMCICISSGLDSRACILSDAMRDEIWKIEISSKRLGTLYSWLFHYGISFSS